MLFRSRLPPLIRIGPLSSTSALSDVHVSWPGPRQAKVMVGETAMSFET